MFRYFMTKGFFRLMMLAALVLFIGVFFYAMEIDRRNTPPEGMRMPAGTAGGKPVVQQAENKVNPLEVQHMSGAEIAMKLSDIVAESLSFTKSNYAYNTAQVEKYFTPTGYAQYKQFLQSASFEEAIANGTLQSAAYAEQEALEITKGVYNGAYKWLFEVPVTISFIPADSKGYTPGQAKPENRRILLRAQFSRVADPNDPLAVKIEIWQVLPPRRV